MAQKAEGERSKQKPAKQLLIFELENSNHQLHDLYKNKSSEDSVKVEKS